MNMGIFSAYPLTWMVIFGAAVVGALCLNSLLKRLPVKSTVRRRSLRRAFVATVFAGFVIPVAVPGAFGLPMLLVFNAIMLTSAGSTLDSTFASTAKLGARDWCNDYAPATEDHALRGRWFMIAIALFGNLPLLSIYLGDHVGPAIIAATTISGTMVMGLAPIFLLSWIRSAGRLSFHLAFWPGLIFGALLTVESAIGIAIFPAEFDVGMGKYADDLGVNLYGLAICTAGYLLGAAIPTMFSTARDKIA